MANASVSALFRHLTGEERDSKHQLSDADLMEQFLQQRDQDAFATLIERHGRMVLGVCQRMLSNVHDAEEAFQATFLVLAQKASTVWPRENVGRWLHGVTCRTALDARKRRARRISKEQQLEKVPEPTSEQRPEHESIFPILDEEISKLSARYRVVLILCDLEGKSRKEAAAILEMPEGTISSRLARARKKLAHRLSRRGVAVSIVALTTLLTQRVASIEARSTITATIQTFINSTNNPSGIANNLAEGVLKTMFVSNIRMIVSGIFVAFLLGTGGVILLSKTKGSGMVAASEPDPIVEKKDMPPKVNSFEGIWAMVEADANGKHLPQEIEKEQRWIIGRNIIIVIHKDQSQEAFQYRLQPDGQPNSIDVWPLRFEGKPFQGLYQLKGDSLTVRYTRNQHPSAERPKHLKIEDDKQFDRGARYFVLRREKPLSMNNSTDSQSWSKAVNGLRGRLMLCDRGILNGTKILGINLELFNATTDTIRLTNDPQDVQVVLMNLGMGELVKESKLPRSGPIPNSGTCNLPRDAYLGFSLDSRTVGIPKNGPTLLPLHNHDWILKPGKYVLSASYSVTKRRSRPQGVWLGTVRLPPVVINIPH